MVFNQKKVVCSLWVGDEYLPQAEEYIGVLFMNDSKLNQQIGASSVVMRALHQFVVVKKELSQKVKLSIY